MIFFIRLIFDAKYTIKKKIENISKQNKNIRLDFCFILINTHFCILYKRYNSISIV